MHAGLRHCRLCGFKYLTVCLVLYYLFHKFLLTTPTPQASNEGNLNRLRKRPLNTSLLAEIREKVTTGLHQLKLETEPKPKKCKREDIVWDLDDDEGSSTSSGHMTDEQRSQMNKRFKKLKVTSKVTDLSGGPSPRRRSVE